MPSSRTYYEILGTTRRASQDDVRAAFRTVSKKEHPDHFPSYVQKVRATQRMQQINDAYQTLRDPVQRMAYDATLPPDGQVASTASGFDTRPPDRAAERDSNAIKGNSRDRSRPIDPMNAWFVLVSAVAGIVYGYMSWGDMREHSFSSFVVLCLGSIVVGFMIGGALALIVGVSVMIVRAAFVAGFKNTRNVSVSSKRQLLRDLALRLVALAAVVLGSIVAWRIPSEVLLIALMALGSGLLGELAAMIVYLSRRRVIHATHVMLRSDLERSGTYANGA